MTCSHEVPPTYDGFVGTSAIARLQGRRPKSRQEAGVQINYFYKSMTVRQTEAMTAQEKTIASLLFFRAVTTREHLCAKRIVLVRQMNYQFIAFCGSRVIRSSVYGYRTKATAPNKADSIRNGRRYTVADFYTQ